MQAYSPVSLLERKPDPARQTSTFLTLSSVDCSRLNRLLQIQLKEMRMGFGAVGLGETSRMPVTRDIQQLAGSLSAGQLADLSDDGLRGARERGVGEML